MKQTEIGLIPDDWEVKSLGEIGEPCMCKRILKEQTSPTGDIPFYKIGTFGGIPDAYISRELFEQYKEQYNYPKKGTLLLSAAGTIGRVVVFDGKDSYFQDSNIVWIDNDETKVTNDFLFYCYSRMQWKTEEGGIVSRLYNANLKSTSFIAPKSLAEQERIAKALTDVDALISTTEKLIQKKKNIKQGAMQNLLTGKKRLPGFGPQTKSPAYKQTELGPVPEDWEVKNIKELGVFISGSGFPLIEQGRKNEKYPFFKVSDFNNLGNENKLISASNYVSETVASKLCCKIVKKNSIVFAKIGAAIMLERKRITAYDCCIDNNMMAFTVNSDNDFSYLCYNFQQIPFASLSSSTALPSLSSKIIGNQLISVPLKEEQTAIANVLSSMDKEIETLNTKLEKYRNLKTAMMQQLLTGKIRLNKGVY